MLARACATFGPIAPTYTILQQAPTEIVRKAAIARPAPPPFASRLVRLPSWDGLRGAKAPPTAATTVSWTRGGAERQGARTAVVAADSSMVEVLVKGAVGAPEKNGDCPFSQRILLTLEEKGVKYTPKYIDTQNKPKWFLDANPEGKVPVLKRPDGSYLADSDVIADLIEKEHPAPSLATPEDKKAVGAKIFPSFVKFLKSQDSNDETEKNLLTELEALNEALESSGGPFIAGDKVTAVDLSLAPKLYHLQVALEHFKGWEVPQELKNVHSYIQALESRESFQKTRPLPEYVVAGWEAHGVAKA